MPNPCKVCGRPDRKLIDLALLAGESRRWLAREIGVSEGSVRNHAKKHIPADLLQERESMVQYLTDLLTIHGKDPADLANHFLDPAMLEESGTLGEALERSGRVFLTETIERLRILLEALTALEAKDATP